METRVAVLSIIVENEDAVTELNELLHRYRQFIIGRLGIPYRQKGVSIICIAMDGKALGSKSSGGFGPYLMVIRNELFSQRWCKYIEEVALR